MASGHDTKAANETYSSFINVVKWATPALAVIAAFVVYLISR